MQKIEKGTSEDAGPVLNDTPPCPRRQSQEVDVAEKVEAEVEATGSGSSVVVQQRPRRQQSELTPLLRQENLPPEVDDILNDEGIDDIKVRFIFYFLRKQLYLQVT